MAKKPDENTWLAAYLHYLPPWENLLTEAVLSFVEKVMENNWATQFFFIRYWEKGPHIRLRFKGNKRLLTEKVKPELIRHFEDYFIKNPWERPEEDTNSKDWYPNNSIRFIDYEPEVKRYGGPAGIKTAEQQFEASSYAVLHAIKAAKSWDYQHAMGVAIQMHLGFVHSIGMSLQQAIRYFHTIFESWLPRAYNLVEDEDPDQRKTETLKAFEEQFRQQKDILITYMKTLREGLENKAAFEQSWLNRWIKDMKQIKDQLVAVQDKLIPPFKYISSEDTCEEQVRNSIYSSYTHMINNRLGIMNHDEGYLGYLLKETLKKL